MNGKDKPNYVISYNKLLKKAKNNLFNMPNINEVSEIELFVNIAMLSTQITKEEKWKGYKLLSMINTMRTNGGGNEKENQFLIYKIINYYRHYPEKDICNNYILKLGKIMPKYSNIVAELTKPKLERKMVQSRVLKITKRKLVAEKELVQTEEELDEMIDESMIQKKNYSLYKIFRHKKNIKNNSNEKEDLKKWKDIWQDYDSCNDNSIIEIQSKNKIQNSISSVSSLNWSSIADILIASAKPRDNNNENRDFLFIKMAILTKEFIVKEKVTLLRPRYIRLKRNPSIEEFYLSLNKILGMYLVDSINVLKKVYLVKKERRELIAKMILGYKIGIPSYQVDSSDVKIINEESKDKLTDEYYIIIDIFKNKEPKSFYITLNAEKCFKCQIDLTQVKTTCDICSFVRLD